MKRPYDGYLLNIYHELRWMASELETCGFPFPSWWNDRIRNWELRYPESKISRMMMYLNEKSDSVDRIIEGALEKLTKNKNKGPNLKDNIDH